MKNPFKNFDFLTAAITTVGVVGGDSYVSPYVRKGVTAIVDAVASTTPAATKSKIVNGGTLAVGLALPFIVNSFVKDKMVTQAAVAVGVGIVANGGKGLANDFGITPAITGPYSGLHTSYIRRGVSGSPDNFTAVAGRMGGSPQNMTSVAGRVGQRQYYAV